MMYKIASVLKEVVLGIFFMYILGGCISNLTDLQPKGVLNFSSTSASQLAHQPVAFCFDYPVGDYVGSYAPWTVILPLGGSWKDSDGKWRRGHLGEDYALYKSGRNSSQGQPVYAAATGIVYLSVNRGGTWGEVMILRHLLFNGAYVYTQYAHLQNRLYKVGDVVMVGRKIAEVGKVSAFIPHLHFEIKNQKAIDEEAFNGIGIGYSGKDGYAPNRWDPDVFISQNDCRKKPVLTRVWRPLN